MRLHLNHRSVVRAVSITFVALLLGLGMLAPGAAADVLTPSASDGGSGGSSASAFVPLTPNQLTTQLTESKEATAQVVITDDNRRRILRLEGLLPDASFGRGGNDASEYCVRCFSYR